MASNAAKTYARAVFELAKEKGALDAWQADLSRLEQVMSDPSVAHLFHNPSVTPEHKQEAVLQLLAGSQPEIGNLIRVLAERDRLDIVPDIVRAYTEARLDAQGIAVADVTTAEPLTPPEQQLVRDQLKRIVGKNIALQMRTDPEIIGGVVARVGDMLIDGSVVSQLRRLRARLAASA
ncbi:MAG: F0F1 ATP synthase subunit delta [Chloroflexota bacterium]|nr:F0F1 ATP synthase subunit delta [Chloroflexota bacterium]